MSHLLRMVYVSTTTNPSQQPGTEIPIDVGRILMQSRKNNPKLEVGGVLYFSNDIFFQCLEGEQDVVNALYQKISTDPRHKDIETLSVKRVYKRQFADWSMKYVATKDRVGGLLKKFGMDEFNPYEFDDYMIEELLNLFTTSDDKTSKPDQNYTSEVKKPNKKKGFWTRLFG